MLVWYQPAPLPCLTWQVVSAASAAVSLNRTGLKVLICEVPTSSFYSFNLAGGFCCLCSCFPQQGPAQGAYLCGTNQLLFFIQPGRWFLLPLQLFPSTGPGSRCLLVWYQPTPFPHLTWQVVSAASAAVSLNRAWLKVLTCMVPISSFSLFNLAGGFCCLCSCFAQQGRAQGS